MVSPQEAASASVEPPPLVTATGTGTSEEQPPPPLHFLRAASPHPPKWSTSIQAFYAGAAAVVAVPPAFFCPSPIWAPQPPYCNAIPCTALYLPVAMPYPACGTEGWPSPPPEEEGNNRTPPSKAEGSPVKSWNDGIGTSASIEIASRMSGDNAMVGSSNTRDGDGQQQDLSSFRIRSYGDMVAEGEVSHLVTTRKHNGVKVESPGGGGPPYAKKLAVSAPGRAQLHSPDTDLNTSLDLWSAANAGPMPLRAISNEMISGPSTLVHDPIVHEQKQKLDEHELRKERRRKSNRESARRSRLRKLQECEDLARTVAELNNEKSVLEVEIEGLKKMCEELEAGNRRIEDQLSQNHGPCYLDVLGISDQTAVKVLFRT